MKNKKLFLTLLGALFFSHSSIFAQEVDMARYITLSITPGAVITLDLFADNANTPIKIVSGNNEHNIIVGTDWTDYQPYTADDTATEMTIYGNIAGFDCKKNNSEKITAIDVSNNKLLKELYCGNNKLSELNVTANEQLVVLNCSNNLLQTLDVSRNKQLQYISCYTNSIATLDFQENTLLKKISCSGNFELTSINVSKNPELLELNCASCMVLSALDVSKNTKLIKLDCYGTQITDINLTNNTALTHLNIANTNRFTALDVSHNPNLKHLSMFNSLTRTADIDALLCSLPNREPENPGIIYLLGVPDAAAAEKRHVLEANIANATAKNWHAQYFFTNTNITDTDNFTGTWQCPATINMSNRITLSVANGKEIHLRLKAANSTPVRIKSGNTITNITVEDTWTDYLRYTTDDNTITIYGNISDIYCSRNGENLTALDASGHTTLTRLWCEDNAIATLNMSGATSLKELWCKENAIASLSVDGLAALTTLHCAYNRLNACALDALFQSLPDKAPTDNARIFIKDSDVTNSGTTGCRTHIANGKNWKVMDFNGGNGDIEINNTSFTCNDDGTVAPNVNNRIVLKVKSGEQIRFHLSPVAYETPLRVVSGNNRTDITLNRDFTGYKTYAADGDIMTIYGDVRYFILGHNEGKVTGIDASEHTTLHRLICSYNPLASVNLSGAKALNSLDSDGCGLTSLDLRGLTDLIRVSCSRNALTALNLTGLSKLRIVHCSDNQLDACAFDALFQSLPDKAPTDNARIYIKSGSGTNSSVDGCRTPIANEKNWKVMGSGDIEINNTTFTCVDNGLGNVVDDRFFTLYPNPANDYVIIETEATGTNITLTDLTGRIMLTATTTDSKTTLPIAHLPAGTYMVRVGNRMAEIVKK